MIQREVKRKMEKHHAFWWAIIVVAGLFTGLYGIELLELSQGTQRQLSSGGDKLTGFAVAGEGEMLTGMAAAVDLSDGKEQSLGFGKGEKKSLSWDTGEDNYGVQEFDIKLVSVSGPARVSINVGEKETAGKSYTIQTGSPLKLSFYGDDAEDLIITLISADKAKGTAKIKAAWLNPLGGASAKDDTKTIPIPQIPEKLPILPPKKDSAAGGACPVSLSNYDVNKDGGVDADDLTELNVQLGSPLITKESCPVQAECPAVEEEAVPTPVVPECSSLADCKSKEACNKKQLASGKLCIWSPVGAEKTVSDKRKGECNSLTACINYEGKCHEPDVFYTAKHICGAENTWAVCDATAKETASYPSGKYTCDGKAWKETATPAAAGTSPAPKADNAPVVQSLLSSFLGKQVTAKEGEKYTGYVLAQDPDGDAITKFEILAVSKDEKKLSKNPFGIDAKGKLDGSWTKSSVTWENPVVGTYSLIIKVTSGIKTATKSTTITDTITVKGKPIVVPAGKISPSLPKEEVPLNTEAEKEKDIIIPQKKISPLTPPISKSSPSMVQININKVLGDNKATKNDWLHIGDEEIQSFNQPNYLLPETVNQKLKFTLPYVIGDNEIFFRVNDVSGSDKYNTEVEIGGKKDWPISDLFKSIGEGTKNKLGDYNGVAFQTFDAGGLKKNKFALKELADVSLHFDLGKEKNNYDDIEIKDLYVRTGIISDKRSYFGNPNSIELPADTGVNKGSSKLITSTSSTPSKQYYFSSTSSFSTQDKVKLRFFVYGLTKPTPSDITNNQWITKLKLNNKDYDLNGVKQKDWPTNYAENSFNPGNHACWVLFPDDLTVLEVEVDPTLIKSNTGCIPSCDNFLTITAGKKTTADKTTYDQFIIDRIELVVNEEDDGGKGYSVKTASRNFYMPPVCG